MRGSISKTLHPENRLKSALVNFFDGQRALEVTLSFQSPKHARP